MSDELSPTQDRPEKSTPIRDSVPKQPKAAGLQEVPGESLRNPPPLENSGHNDKRGGLPENELPTEQITTRKITWERARLLATTRRGRMSEFAIGGFFAALPGAAQSVINYYTVTPKIAPSGGHLIEIGIAIIFGTLTISSLFEFRKPTSADILEKTFPEMVEQERFIRRCRRWMRQLQTDFKIPI